VGRYTWIQRYRGLQIRYPQYAFHEQSLELGGAEENSADNILSYADCQPRPIFQTQHP